MLARLLVPGLALAVLAALAIARVLPATHAAPVAAPTLSLHFTAAHAADPTDGPALTHEAIGNVRGMKKFRFTQTIESVQNAQGSAGVAGGAGGTASGEVELSSGSTDLPRLHTTTTLHNKDKSDVAMEIIAVGDEVRAKLPHDPSFHKASGLKPPKKGKGKPGGGGTGSQVDVMDPVMLLLEPIDDLPDAAFGTPSDVDTDGNRSVTVQLDEAGASLVLVIDDADHFVRGIQVSTVGGRKASYGLQDFGDASIDIQLPS